MPWEPSTAQRRALAALTPVRLAAIYAHASICNPEECCGLVTDRGVRLSRNVQDALHAQDPEAFPRDAAHGFHLAPEDQLYLARSFDSPTPVRVLYHSHPSGGAHFSKADFAGATIAGDPLYPALVYLVVSLRDGRVDESRAHAWAGHGYREIASFDHRGRRV